MSTIYKNGVPYLGITQAQDMSVQVGNNTLNLQSTIQNILGDFAPIESNPVSKAYSVGQYLIFNGNLYKVITNIAQGGTLVVGTNVQATTVNNELTSLGGAAYQNVANNLTTTTEGSVLDARQGKALNDSIAALNSSTVEIANTVENKTNLGSVYFRTLLNTGTSNRIRIRTTGSGTFMVLSMDRRESGITVAAIIDRYGTTDTCSVLSNGFSGTFTVSRDAYGTIVTLPNNNQGLIILGNLDFSIDAL